MEPAFVGVGNLFADHHCRLGQWIVSSLGLVEEDKGNSRSRPNARQPIDMGLTLSRFTTRNGPLISRPPSRDVRNCTWQGVEWLIDRRGSQRPFAECEREGTWRDGDGTIGSETCL